MLNFWIQTMITDYQSWLYCLFNKNTYQSMNNTIDKQTVHTTARKIHFPLGMCCPLLHVKLTPRDHTIPFLSPCSRALHVCSKFQLNMNNIYHPVSDWVLHYYMHIGTGCSISQYILSLKVNMNLNVIRVIPYIIYNLHWPQVCTGYFLRNKS
jgi:hypothetical protein